MSALSDINYELKIERIQVILTQAKARQRADEGKVYGEMHVTAEAALRYHLQ